MTAWTTAEATHVTTYGDVVEFVADKLPDFEGERMVFTLMENALHTLWTDLWRHRYFQTRWSLPLVSGQREYELSDMPALRYVVELRYEDKPLKSLRCWPEIDTTGRRIPSGWYAWGNSFLLDPSPVFSGEQVLEVRGIRAPIARFKTGATWQEIDLPFEFRSIFAKTVLALGFAHCEDYASSQFWLEVVASEMKTALARANMSLSQGTCEDRLFVMNSISDQSCWTDFNEIGDGGTIPATTPAQWGTSIWDGPETWS